MPMNVVPTALKILQGNPGHRPLNQNEPQPDRGAEMPDDLTTDAKKHWPKIATQLEAAGLLTKIDAAALALYCEAYARWRDACANVTRYGTVVKSPKGYPIQSPYLSIANRAHEQMVSLLKEFVMTPASRSKVSAAPQTQKENPFLRMLKTIDPNEPPPVP